MTFSLEYPSDIIQCWSRTDWKGSRLQFRLFQIIQIKMAQLYPEALLSFPIMSCLCRICLLYLICCCRLLQLQEQTRTHCCRTADYWPSDSSDSTIPRNGLCNIHCRRTNWVGVRDCSIGCCMLLQSIHIYNIEFFGEADWQMNFLMLLIIGLRLRWLPS